MRFFLLILLYLAYYMGGVSQIINNPVFDRSDIPAFRVEKVEMSPDTTIISCLYHAEDNSWANISNRMCLEDVNDGTKYHILKVSGIPFSPNRQLISESSDIQVVLYFPHVSAKKINIIENEENDSFNIYGIDLNSTYQQTFTDNDIDAFRKLAAACEEANEWQSAIEYTQKQLEASQFVYGLRSKESSWAMYNLTMNYLLLKDYNKAIEWGKKVIDVLSVLPKDSANVDVLARAYGNVSTAYQLLNQHELAFDYQEKSLAIRRLKEGVGSLNYEDYLGRLAKDYYDEGNYPKALLYGREAACIFEKKFGDRPMQNAWDYIHALNNLSQYYLIMNKTAEGLGAVTNAFQLYETEYGKNGPEWLKYAVCHNYAVALASVGRTDDAITLLSSVLKISPDTIDRTYINSKILLASLYIEKQQIQRGIGEYETVLHLIEDSLSSRIQYPSEYVAVLFDLYEGYIRNDKATGLQYLRKAIRAQKEWYGDNSAAYAIMLLEFVKNTWEDSVAKMKGLDELYMGLRESSEILKRHISNSIYNMSNKDRKDYWRRYEWVFTWLIPTISGLLKTDEWNALAYDASLFCKGMLLSSENEVKNVVYSSGDSSLIDLYNGYVQDLSLLEKLYSEKNMSIGLDSLKSEIHDKEFLLSQKVTRFNKRNIGTNISWKDIKDKLNDSDVAIEIVSYDSYDVSTKYYYAYVVSRKSVSPIQVFLCDERELKAVIKDDSTDYQELSNIIWGNEDLLLAIGNATNIYFSVAGMLNSVGIEYLPVFDDKYIFDVFNLYRLSSTREMVFGDSLIDISNACLYGGLDYNSSLVVPSNDVDVSCTRISRTMTRPLIERGGFEQLEGSREEVQSIEKEMKDNDINCIIHTEVSGTEESFKRISGKEINLIHLSTHGMYISSNDSIPSSVGPSSRFVFLRDDSGIDEEDRALSHSFLVMSGGNKLLHQDSIPVGMDDGILTALEISHLTFKKLDLVVLSACETALGDVNNEGVYGLQRGFKKAGANTILVSLDKVDDEATRILMVEFYKNLMAGKSKHQSLKDAQHYLRIVENGKYDDPKYWASFIMLDGVN